MDTLVLALTAVAIIWYTLETRMLRQATQQQTTMEIEPFVDLDSSSGNVIRIINKGRGIARHIKFRISDNPENLDLVNIESLGPNEVYPIFIRINADKRILFRHKDLLNWIDVEYTDSLGQKYWKRFRRADYDDGLTTEDRDACEGVPQWVVQEYFENDNTN